MANSTHIIRITTADSAAQLSEYLPLTAEKVSQSMLARRLRKFFGALANGTGTSGTCSIAVGWGGVADVQASATATIVTAVATDSITINGVAFAGVASGPTGNQWIVGSGGTADADSATALAAAINAATTAKIAGYVTATAAAGVVTIKAIQPGLAGNMFTLTKNGTPITVTGSGFLTGGAGGNIALTTYSGS